MKHDGVAYCFQCKEYPCPRYNRGNDKDSFITYLHVPSDMNKANQEGLDVYLEQLAAKSDILDILLEKWDNGRLKSFFCLAVNLLPLDRLVLVMDELGKKRLSLEGDSKTDRSAYGILAKDALNQHAAAIGLELKLRR
jgi:hypothetical protein